jgi:hypothetical protein
MGQRASERMFELASRWKQHGDRRALFADAYGRMTEAMLEAIANGEFRDADWVSRLLDRFADYYFDAVEMWDGGGSDCPVVCLGINAHINHDLVYALADVLDDWDKLDAMSRLDREVDHRNVNLVIARTVDVVQDEVIDPCAPILGVLDEVFAGLDEWLFSRLIAGWRSDVWDQTQRLLVAPDRSAVEAEVIERTSRIARTVAVV